MTAEERAALVEALEAHQTFYLATSVGDEPWINGAFFGYEAAESLTLYCAARNPSRKLDNLRRNPGVAFLMAGSRPDLWVQGTGRAEVLEDPDEARAAMDVVVSHAPDVIAFLANRPYVMVRIRVAAFRVTDLRGERRVVFVDQR